jgi:hypothetical protein
MNLASLPLHQNAIRAFCDYLKQSGDSHSHYYEIADSPYECPLIEGAPTFGDRYRIHVIDSFARKRPMLVNLDFINSTSEYRLEAAITLVLDSQLLSGLHEYREARSGMDVQKRVALRSLLQYASTRGYDYNPLFYLIESFHRMPPGTFVKEVAPVVASLLHFQSMDSAHFAKFDEIRLKPDALDYYFTLYGEHSLEECGRVWVERFQREHQPLDLPHVLRASYSCLLKMTLIHKRESGTLERKFEEFQTFVSTELGCNLAWESHLALYYFAGLVGKFLPVQSTMALEDAKSALWSTVWDLLLLRMPEFLLRPTQLPRINLGYVCSADKPLFELGQLFTVMRLIMQSNSDLCIGPVLGMNMEALREKIGAEALKSVMAISARSWPENRPERAPKPARKDHVLAIVADLEAQMASLCRE